MWGGLVCLQIFWSEFEPIPNTSAPKKFVPDLLNAESSSGSDELTGLRQSDAELVCHGNKEWSGKTSRSYLVPAESQVSLQPLVIFIVRNHHPNHVTKPTNQRTKQPTDIILY